MLVKIIYLFMFAFGSLRRDSKAFHIVIKKIEYLCEDLFENILKCNVK